MSIKIVGMFMPSSPWPSKVLHKHGEPVHVLYYHQVLRHTLHSPASDEDGPSAAVGEVCAVSSDRHRPARRLENAEAV
jgi:hypothetical protein